MTHPCKVQLRGFNNKEIEIARKFAEKLNGKLIDLDIYFEDVNDARKFISKLKKILKFDLKMSTEYIGMVKGKKKILFVYSLRK